MFDFVIISPAVWYKPGSAFFFFCGGRGGELRPAASSPSSLPVIMGTHIPSVALWLRRSRSTSREKPTIWRLGLCQMGNLIRGHFMQRKCVSLLVREWFIWTVILGSCSRPQLIAWGREVYDFNSLTGFSFTASLVETCSQAWTSCVSLQCSPSSDDVTACWCNDLHCHGRVTHMIF